MTAPIPEEPAPDEKGEPTATDDGRRPPGELPDEHDGATSGKQEENAKTALDEPSDATGGER